MRRNLSRQLGLDSLALSLVAPQNVSAVQR
jgi:hypothetical protein